MKISKQLRKAIGLSVGDDMEFASDCYYDMDTASAIIEETEGVLKKIVKAIKQDIPNLVTKLKTEASSIKENGFSYAKKLSNVFLCNAGEKSFNYQVRYEYTIINATNDWSEKPEVDDKNSVLNEKKLSQNLCRGQMVVQFILLSSSIDFKAWKAEISLSDEAFDVEWADNLHNILRRWKKDPDTYTPLICSAIEVIDCHLLFSLNELSKPSEFFTKNLVSSISNAFKTNSNRWRLLDLIKDLSARLNFEPSVFKQSEMTKKKTDGRQEVDLIMALKSTTLKLYQKRILADLLNDDSIMDWVTGIDFTNYLDLNGESDRKHWVKNSKVIEFIDSLIDLVIVNGKNLNTKNSLGLSDSFKKLEDRLSPEYKVLRKIVEYIVSSGGLNIITLNRTFKKSLIQLTSFPIVQNKRNGFDKTLLDLIFNTFFNTIHFTTKEKRVDILKVYDVCYTERRQDPDLELLLANSRPGKRLDFNYNGRDFYVDPELQGLVRYSAQGNVRNLDDYISLSMKNFCLSVAYKEIHPDGFDNDVVSDVAENHAKKLVEFFHKGLLNTLFQNNNAFTQVIHTINAITCGVLVEYNNNVNRDEFNNPRIQWETFRVNSSQDLPQGYLTNVGSFVCDNMVKLTEWFYAYKTYAELYLAENSCSGLKDYYFDKTKEIKDILQPTLDVFGEYTSKAIARFDDFEHFYKDPSASSKTKVKNFVFPSEFNGSSASLAHRVTKQLLLANHSFDQYLTTKRRWHFATFLRELNDCLLTINVELDHVELLMNEQKSELKWLSSDNYED